MKKVKFFTRGLTFHMAVVIVFWFLLFNMITSIIGYNLRIPGRFTLHRSADCR